MNFIFYSVLVQKRCIYSLLLTAQSIIMPMPDGGNLKNHTLG